jgi:hypothetical protein
MKFRAYTDPDDRASRPPPATTHTSEECLDDLSDEIG